MIAAALILLANAPAVPAPETDRLVMPVFCPAKGADGSNRSFKLTYHLTTAGKWNVEVAPAKGSVTPHKAYVLRDASAEANPGVKGTVKPFVVVVGFATVDGKVYGLSSTLTIDGGAVTGITASLSGEKYNSVDRTVTCGAVPASEATK